MERLTQEQMADMAVVINKVTSETMRKVLDDTGMGGDLEQRIVSVASMCAAQAVVNALAYLYEVEDNGAPTAGPAGSSPLQ